MRLDEPLDQASGLRRLLAERSAFQALGVFGPDAGLNAIAAASLAFAFSRRGEAVWVIDEAVSPRNAATQLGLGARFSLADVARGGLRLDEVLLTGPGGVRLLPAESGVDWVAEMGERGWGRMLDDLREVEPAWMLLTSPAGDRPCFAHAAPFKLLVLPAQKNRLPEAYAVMKAARQRQPDGRWLVLVMDAADEDKARQHMTTLADTARRFLQIQPEYLGSVPRDDKLEMASRAMRPLLDVSPNSPSAAAFRALVERIDRVKDACTGVDVETFWQRLGLFSRMVAGPHLMESANVRNGRAYG